MAFRNGGGGTFSRGGYDGSSGSSRYRRDHSRAALALSSTARPRTSSAGPGQVQPGLNQNNCMLTP